MRARLTLIVAIILCLLALLPPEQMANASPFVGQMFAHLLMVVIVPPLLIVVMNSRARLVSIGPLLAATFEFVVVWGWHLPLLYRAARNSLTSFLLEQGLFLVAGLLA